MCNNEVITYLNYLHSKNQTEKLQEDCCYVGDYLVALQPPSLKSWTIMEDWRLVGKWTGHLEPE